MDRQITTVVVQRGAQIEFDQSHGVFKLASFVLRADRAAIGDRYVTLAYVLRATQFDSVAREASVWVLGHQEFDDVST